MHYRGKEQNRPETHCSHPSAGRQYMMNYKNSYGERFYGHCLKQVLIVYSCPRAGKDMRLVAPTSRDLAVMSTPAVSSVRKDGDDNSE